VSGQGCAAGPFEIVGDALSRPQVRQREIAFRDQLQEGRHRVAFVEPRQHDAAGPGAVGVEQPRRLADRRTGR
jgi:hypothetical protein